MKTIFLVFVTLLFLLSCGTKNYLTKIFNPDMAKVKVNHTQLYYEKAGEGVPVVFIHGFSLDGRMWDPQFNVFAKKYTVIRYDLRGFGQSALPVEGENYTHHDDLAALLDYLGIDKVILIGLSMGGRVAASFALAHPTRVLCMVLIDSVLEGYAMKNYKMDYIYETAKNESIPAALKLWLAHPTFEATNKNVAVAGHLSRIVGDYSGWHFTYKNPLVPMKPPGIDQLTNIQTPTLILVGKLDLPDFQEIAILLDQKIPHSQLEVIKGAGHMSNMEKPQTLNKLVFDFLNKEMPGK